MPGIAPLLRIQAAGHEHVEHAIDAVGVQGFPIGVVRRGLQFSSSADITDAADEFERIVAGEFAKGNAAAAVNRLRGRTRCHRRCRYTTRRRWPEGGRPDRRRRCWRPLFAGRERRFARRQSACRRPDAALVPQRHSSAWRQVAMLARPRVVTVVSTHMPRPTLRSAENLCNVSPAEIKIGFHGCSVGNRDCRPRRILCHAPRVERRPTGEILQSGLSIRSLIFEMQ